MRSRSYIEDSAGPFTWLCTVGLNRSRWGGAVVVVKTSGVMGVVQGW
jgi:hypothetical protein